MHTTAIYFDHIFITKHVKITIFVIRFDIESFKIIILLSITQLYLSDGVFNRTISINGGSFFDDVGPKLEISKFSY